MISVCDNCKQKDCKFKNKNPFSCDSSDRKVRKIENDRFRYDNTRKNWLNNTGF